MSERQIKDKIAKIDKELKNETDLDVILLKWMQISCLQKELKKIKEIENERY